MELNPITIIILFTVIVSMQGFSNPEFLHRWSFSPYEVKHSKKNYKFFTHLFVHADWAHLAFNMFSFYLLGDGLLNGKAYEPVHLTDGLIESYGPYLGNLHFIVLFIMGGLIATFWPMIRNQDNPLYTSVGASGGVSAVVFAMILWNPFLELELVFLPIFKLPAYIFGPLYLVFEFWAFKRGKTNIAHDAHIGGAIFGIVYILIINIDKGKDLITQLFG